MEAVRLEKGSPVMVDAVINGLGPVKEKYPRQAVEAALSTLVDDGVLTISGGKYTLTEHGELTLYPGSDEDNVLAVVHDLENYMLRNDPDKSLHLQAYRADIRRRLTPRQAAASVVDQAIKVLVNERSLTPSGLDTYIVSE